MPEAEVRETLVRAAERRGITLDAGSLHSLLQVTGRFSAARPQPGPALKLARETLRLPRAKRAIGEHEPVSPASWRRSSAITSGLPLFVVSREATMPAPRSAPGSRSASSGSGAAIEAVMETIALFKAGLHDPHKPIGTFLFVGPTGVGKTELARALATFLFGSPSDSCDSISPSSRTTAPSSFSSATPRRRRSRPAAQSGPRAAVPGGALRRAREGALEHLGRAPAAARRGAPDDAVGRDVELRATRSSSPPPTSGPRRRRTPWASARARLTTRAKGDPDGAGAAISAGVHQSLPAPDGLSPLSAAELRSIARQEVGRVLAREGYRRARSGGRRRRRSPRSR